MDDFLKNLLSKVDREELINELKKDKDFNRLMNIFSELFNDGKVPTIKIEMKPNDDTTYSLQIQTEGSMTSIISGLSEIVANIMYDMSKKGVLREDAYENFGTLVKMQVEELKKKEK